MTQEKAAPADMPDQVELKFKIKNPLSTFRYAGLFLLVFILIRNLWVSDDAFITLRTVSNFIHGYGLVWNVGERVQVFTHPLWMLLLIPFNFFVGDPLYAFYIPSLMLSIGTLLILFWNFAHKPIQIALAVVLLGSSAAFVDFSSSGLENPLTHLIVIAFLVIYFQSEAITPKRFFQLSLLAGLATLNRIDILILLLPALVQIGISRKGQFLQSGLYLLAGFLPFIAWELFSIFYYGFPFPNTYYAKAATGLPSELLYKQGIAYIENSFHWDPLTLGTVLFGVLSLFNRRDAKRVSIAAGCILYLFYILWIGGDFMSGRYFSAMFLMGLTLVLTLDLEKLFSDLPPRTIQFGYLILILVGLSSDRPPITTHLGQPGLYSDQYGIVSERFYYFDANGWINYFKFKGRHELAVKGIEASQAKISPVEMNTTGMFGYYAGPDIYIIDTHSLSDPLRAHLPVDGPSRIGHYERAMPAGYLETIQSGFQENLIVHPDLRRYYEKLSILTRGDLLAPGRFQEIIRFNTGYYDTLIQSYWRSVHP